jgi:hypothetical protein
MVVRLWVTLTTPLHPSPPPAKDTTAAVLKHPLHGDDDANATAKEVLNVAMIRPSAVDGLVQADDADFPMARPATAAAVKLSPLGLPALLTQPRELLIAYMVALKPNDTGLPTASPIPTPITPDPEKV